MKLKADKEIASQSYSIQNTNLNEGWEFRQFGESKWYPASVPGCVHLDLLTNGLIEDPFYRDNERKLQWIGEVDWEYRLIFDADTKLLSKKHVEIVFDGLDTYATVTLNGQEILRADNMFHPWKADVKPQLKKGKNELYVYFRSPIQVILPKLKK